MDDDVRELSLPSPGESPGQTSRTAAFHGRARRWARSTWAPAAALCCIGLLDLIGPLARLPIMVEGVRDEAAHALTAALFLAVVPGVADRLAAWVLVGAVVIDLDHIPLYAWDVGSVGGSGRPVTHSLSTILVLLAFAGLYRRWRMSLLALALGVMLHFVRDIATGPGLPLVWPVSPASLLLPYPWYAALLVAVTVASTGRQLARRKRA